MKIRSCLVRVSKIFAGLVFVGLMLIYRGYKDFPASRARDAQGSVRAALGDNATSNEYFVVFGFLQGCTCYYRADITPDVARNYIKSHELTPITNKQAIRKFNRASPYWWSPGREKHVEYFGRGETYCMFSWNPQTGRCHILLHGG
jgi:hypothetical protein